MFAVDVRGTAGKRLRCWKYAFTALTLFAVMSGVLEANDTAILGTMFIGLLSNNAHPEQTLQLQLGNAVFLQQLKTEKK